MCISNREREREICVCVCERERERERERETDRLQVIRIRGLRSSWMNGFLKE